VATSVDAGADATALQAAIDDVAEAVSAGGYGVVEGRHDVVYDVSETITLPSNVYLRDMHLRMADGAQTTVIKSGDFDALDGSNAGSVTDGVPYNFGLINVTVDGNKHNNGGRELADSGGAGRWHWQGPPQSEDRTGRGIALYGLRYLVDNVVVHSCPRTGFYSACGDQGGQGGWRDLPEAQIGRLWVRACDGHGIVFRGPHDAQAEMLVANANDGRGAGIFTDTGTYSANGFVCSRLHTYGNRLPQRITAPSTFFWNYVDNDPGCIVDKRSVMYHVRSWSGKVGSGKIVANDTLQLFHAMMRGSQAREQYSHGDDGLTINAAATYVGHVDVRRYDGSGIVLNANGVTVDSAKAARNGGHGIELVGEADRDGIYGCDVTATTVNRNDEGGVYYRGGDRNRVRATGYVSEGYRGYDTDGALPGQHDDFSLVFNRADTTFAKSHDSGQATFSGDGSTRRFRVEHDLIETPETVTLTPLSGNPPLSVGATDLGPDGFDVTYSEPPAAGSTPAVSWTVSL
jgi:hypothetical protein